MDCKSAQATMVVKADNHGSLKTVLDFIAMVPRDEVDIKVCETGVGEISASDIQHAARGISPRRLKKTSGPTKFLAFFFFYFFFFFCFFVLQMCDSDSGKHN